MTLAKIVHPSSKITRQKTNNFPPDGLTELPDEILEFILSLLTLKEMQRTSVLSRRWRYLWTFVTHNLVFDHPNLPSLRKKMPNLDFMVRTKSGLVKILSFCRTDSNWIDIKSSEMSSFVSWVNQVLELHQGNTIDEFRVSFYMNASFTQEIDNWISFSLKKRVKKLSLDFRPICCIHYISYTLRSQFLHGYSLDSLTDLYLSFVDVNGKVLDYVLSNCPFIERLHVESSKSLVNLKTSVPLPKLKHLEILKCSKLRHFQISSINLVSFKYCGLRNTKFLLGDVPNFVDLSVNFDYVHYLAKNKSSISPYLSQLETFGLCFLIKRSLSFPRFPELRNLRELKLYLYPDVMNSLRICTSLLKAFPVLHRLVIKFIRQKASMKGKIEVRRNKNPHQYLKMVELIGFVGCAVDMELALNLINKAVSLEKIIIDTQSTCVEETFHVSSDPVNKLAAINYAKQLETRLAPGVELVIL